MVERKFVRFRFSEQLHRQFPLGKLTVFDRLEQSTAVEVLIGASNFYRFIPNGRLQAQFGSPVKFYKGRDTGIVD